MSFAALMAISATQDKQHNVVVQKQLEERQRKLEAERRKKEEQERKARELEKQRQQQHFENLKREQEKEKQRLEKEKAIEAERLRREQIQRDNLLYGPKKAASKYPTSNSQIREQVRKGRVPDDEEPHGAPALTREELRARKVALEERKIFSPTPKRASHHSHSRKPGKRLPGGALDTTVPVAAPPPTAGQTTRERIAAIPPTLMKLNVVKRDLRTIDEIQTQLKNAKSLEGDEARGFNDFFIDRKKDMKHGRTATSTGTASPAASQPSTTSSSVGKAGSKSSTPVPASTPKAVTPVPRHTIKTVSTTSRASSIVSSSRATSVEKVKPQPTHKNGYVASAKKRSRSSSFSESPPPPKRRRDDDHYQPGQIYQLMRGGRQDYDNIFSDDDEDMEADASDLEKEEIRSYRLAKKEDAQALAAEKHHEEEKLRRKKEKQLAAKKGGL